ncbi:MAG: LegC family aminotransferase [Candidatus Saganbacteria bacterium]|nr:LegC family aminotransferase [Candidatus Saganbacteria bacterium]
MGGGPVSNIPLCVPEIRGNEWLYIKDCLDTNWVSSVGEYVNRFESSFANYLGVRHAVACINGTAAIHISLLLLGVQSEDEVIIPALSFVAPANAVRYLGAWPVFIDVDPNSWQMDPNKLVEFLMNECDWVDGKLINRHTVRQIKAVLPVHILGHPVDMDPILEIAGKFDLRVIEDATESLGAFYKKRKVGTLGDIACFSFNGNKLITTGGGGMLVTNDESLAKRARYLITQAKDDQLEYIHNEVGYNYRLSNIQAAMGLAQMEKLDEYIEAKRKLALRWNEGLSSLPGVVCPISAKWAKSVFWLYTILINKDKYGIGSRELLKELNDSGIQARPFWHPLHLLKPFKNSYSYKIEIANRLYSEGLSLPSSVGLKQEEQDKVIEVICRLKKEE